MFDQQGSKKNLQVVIENIEFAKKFHYFITVEIDGDNVRRRTDISERVGFPVFAQNKFYLPIHEERLQKNPRLIFRAFLVANRVENMTDEQVFGQAKQLGACEIEIAPMMPQLVDVYGVGVRKKLEFSRRKEDTGENAVVARGAVSIKLVGDYISKFDSVADGQAGAPQKAMGNQHALPAETPRFAWRVRCDVRHGENLPLNDVIQGGLPSFYLEFGWSDTNLNANHESPVFLSSSQETTKSLMVERNVNPQWNQQLLFHNPDDVIDHVSGFFIIQIRDIHRATPYDQVSVPMELFQPYRPAHFRFISRHRENPAQVYQVYVSLTLEVPMKGVEDKVVAIPITWVKFNPQDAHPVKTFSVLCATKSFAMSNIPVLEYDPREHPVKLADLFSFHNTLEFNVFQSLWFNIPPTAPENQFSALAAFIMPKSFLNQGMLFQLLLSNQLKPAKSNNPDKVWGQTPAGMADKALTLSLNNPPHKPSQYPLQPVPNANPQFSKIRATIEAACVYLDGSTLQLSSAPGDGILDIPGAQIQMDVAQFLEAQKFEPKSEQDIQKWQLLARELAQKQEIIHRMMRENDEKNQSLKLATSEVVDLRRTLKMMQSENAILRKQMASEEASQLQNLVAKEIASMSNEELKHKVIKLAQAYRSERIRNEYFEKALKSANVDLAQTKRVATELEQVTAKHEKLRQTFSSMTKEMQKIGLYKDTIRKQEKVIVKLENLLNKTLTETQRARDGILELEKLKTENLELQAQLKNDGYADGEDPKLVQQLRDQIEEQERTIEELRRELQDSRGPQEEGIADWEEDKIGMELQLEQQRARTNALEDEQVAAATSYANEIANLKAQLIQYESQRA